MSGATTSKNVGAISYNRSAKTASEQQRRDTPFVHALDRDERDVKLPRKRGATLLA